MDQLHVLESVPEESVDHCTTFEVSEDHLPLVAASALNNPGASKPVTRVSPVRSHTMREYDQQITDLKKENFSLKMRIYYMEERIQQRSGGQNLDRPYIELQLEIDNLKRELIDKECLVHKAAQAMETLAGKPQQDEEVVKNRLLEDYNNEVTRLHGLLDGANKSLKELTGQLAQAEESNRRLRQQLSETSATKEKLAKSLSEKESELAGFQGQLKKALDALHKSEEALEMLQSRLKSERAEFDTALMKQALHFQLQSAEYKQKLEACEQELQSLRSEINSRDMKIQAAESYIHQMDHHQKETCDVYRLRYDSNAGENTGHQVHDLSSKLLQNMKLLMDSLQQEANTLITFQHLLEDLHKPEHGASNEILRQISSVQHHYQQLKERMEENWQLHQAFLYHLRAEYEQSYSNSCYDGGDNLGTGCQHVRSTGLPASVSGSRSQQQRSDEPEQSSENACVSSVGQALNVEICPDLVTRSVQTDTSFSRVDQEVQTSLTERDGQRPKLKQVEDIFLVRSNLSPGTVSHFSTSSTNDAKEEDLGHHEETTEDCQQQHHVLLFDDCHCDSCRHDRASAERFRSHNITLTVGNSSEGITPTSIVQTSAGDRNRDYCEGVQQHYYSRCHNHSPASDKSDLTVVSYIDSSSCHGVTSDTDEPDGTVSQPGAQSDSKVHGSSRLESEGLTSTPKNLSGSLNVESLRSEASVQLSHGGDSGYHSHLKVPVPGVGSRHRHLKVPDLTNVHSPNDCILSNPPSKEGKQERFVKDKCNKSWEEDQDVEVSEGTEKNGVCEIDVRKKEINQRKGELEQHRMYHGRSDEAKIPSQNQDIMRHPQIQHFHHKRNKQHNQQQQLEAIAEISSAELKKIDSKTEQADLVFAANHSYVLQKQLEVPHARILEPGDAALEDNNNCLRIKELEGKLQATENTVRLLSKRNKAYVSALRAAGIPVSLMKRSHSETFLNSLSESLGKRASSLDDVSPVVSGSCNGDTSTGSPCKETDESIEKARSYFCDTLSQCGTSLYVTRSIVATPSEAELSSPGAHMSGDRSVSHLSNLSQTYFVNSTWPQTEDSLPQVDSSFSHPALSAPVNVTASFTPDDSTSSVISTVKTLPLCLNSKLGSPKNESLICEVPSPDSSENHSYNSAEKESIRGHESVKRHAYTDQSQSSTPKMESSIEDRSRCQNVTYSSILDGTVLNRLLAKLEHDMSDHREDSLTVSDPTVEQLRLRLEHLRRVNLTLRQEIEVYEALYHNKEVSRDLSKVTEMSEENLLRQHLTEIRKLRQQLEKLDVARALEQHLIPQSCTQKGATSQETLIADLQRQIAEKGELWQRELTELQHKHSRDKMQIVEELEFTVSELQETVRNQSTKIREQEEQIVGMKSQLNVNEEKERQSEEELKKMAREKEELNFHVIKCHKDLELMKERCDLAFWKLNDEMKEREEEIEKFKLELEKKEDYSRCLKDIVVKRERSLQEKVSAIHKLTIEKAAGDDRLREREERVKKLELELDCLKKEMREMRAGLAEETELRAEIDTQKKHLKKREFFHANGDVQKVVSEIEVKRITEDEMKLRTQLELVGGDSAGLKFQVDEFESKLIGKVTLENQITALNGEIKSLSKLESEIDQLKAELEHKTRQESKLREVLSHVQPEAESLRQRLVDTEDGVRMAEKLRSDMIDELKEKDERLQKRDKQLHHLFGQYKKLESAFVRQKQILNKKQEIIQTLKNRMQPKKVVHSCSSSEVPVCGEEESSSSDVSRAVMTPSAGNIINLALAEVAVMSGMKEDGPAGTVSKTKVGPDVSSLCAVLRHDCYEKILQGTRDCLVSLRSVEAGLANALMVDRSQSVWEMIEKDTVRETSVLCKNLRTNLEEAADLFSTAWITELPQNNAQGHLFDQVLIQNENLRQELARLRFQYDTLNDSLDQKSDKYNGATRNPEMWEASLYRQLFKTVKDLKQAKENIGASLAGLPPPLGQKAIHHNPATL